jgi:hypothetical protein
VIGPRDELGFDNGTDVIESRTSTADEGR